MKQLSIILLTLLLSVTAQAQFRPIHNDTFWNTADGRPIYSQGGGIFRFKNPQTGREQYYWYGVRYQEAVLYRERPYQMMPENCRFEGVTCYRSDNLVDWTEVGDVLTADEVERHAAPTWMGRMGVVYVPEKQLYTLVIQHGDGVLFATSKSPEGPFQWYHRRVMTPLIGTPNTGDQTVFTDDDTGKSYLIYSYGRGRNRAYVSEIGLVGDSIDLMDCQEVYQGLGREGNCMFKYKGRYYLCASNLYGWNSSLAYYLVANDIHGPYQPLNDMQVMAGCEKDYAHVTQTGFFVTLHGSEQETVVYCGDRWAEYANNGLGYNQWVPLSFNGTQPVFNSLSSWELDAQTGCWRVGADNNYVLNGSFEADRRIIPNPVKPRQEFLRGWETTIISGHAVSVGDSLSPRLNYALQEEDHPHVIGNHCLQLHDCVPYERRVSQTVTSTPSIPLPAGTYTLRCKVRGGENFEQMDVFITADGETHRQRITPHSQWTTITLSGVPIHNGQAEVGFHVRAQANAWCLIDDVELTKEPTMVIIVAGQSNTDGRIPADEFDKYIHPIPNCFWRMGSGGEERTKGCFEPFTPEDKTQRRFAKWGYDAFLYQALGRQLGTEPFYVVKWALGGTAIDTLNQNSNHGHYWCADETWMQRVGSSARGGKSLLKAFEDLIGDAIDRELSQLPQGYRIRAFVWHQGESDSEHGENYGRNLKMVVNHVRQYLVRKTGDESYAHLPFIFGTVSEINRQFSREVKNGMRWLAAEDENCHIIDVGSAELLPDRLHFTAHSARQLASAMYDKMLELDLVGASPQTMTWFNGRNPVSYNVEGAIAPVVATAIDMFCDDMVEVTSLRPVAKKADAIIQLLQLDKASKSELGKWRLRGLQVDSLLKLKDGFQVKVVDGRIYVAGSDGRGLAYGLLELSRMAGVSPWKWWSDVTPELKSRLTLPADYETLQSPSVEYRGIFLNDEDWTLQPWSWRHYAPGKPGFISAKTYRQIFRLLMRLRANAIWPGMHGMSSPFFTIPGAKEVADSCGIVIGTSHCEPMMRNNVGEWSVGERGEYNYMTNREAVQQYWIERLKETGRYENFYTIGMRGIHDSGMEGVGKDLDEQTAALQQVIDDQRELLKKYVDKRVERIPQQFVPYKEVLQVMENGLRLPDDVTLTWCDDNYGYMTRLSDSLQQKRSGGGGVYYHLSYWGRPHDYMWLSTTQPGLIYNEMHEAYDHQVRKLWIVNVHDMKTAAYDLELFLDMAWDINSLSPTTLYRHQQAWLCREFGAGIGRQLLPVMQEFYRLTAIRKPEFMGWTQVELDKRKFWKGWSPVIDSEFSLMAFGGELDRYLNDWQQVLARLNNIAQQIPTERKDAFFSHIQYPVEGAAAMSVKMLEAQRARAIAKANYDPERWERHDSLMTACAKSQAAYQHIRQLTDYYNHQLAGGKWQYSMCDHPRDLPVFYAPTLPVGLTDTEIRQYKDRPDATALSLTEAVNGQCVVRNACQYQQAGKDVQPVQSLGHSMNAVRLPKNQTVTYDFDCEKQGEALLRVAVIPTQPNDTGDLRFSVSIDGGEPQVCSIKEPFRSEQWKQNVLRGQAVKHIPVIIERKGKHQLIITALDHHVVIDQWMLDFDKERPFYVFPITPSY